MRTILVASCLAVSCLTFTGCINLDAAPSNSRSEQRAKADQAEATVAAKEKFDFMERTEKARQANVAQNWGKLRVGLTLEEVIGLLGPVHRSEISRIEGRYRGDQLADQIIYKIEKKDVRTQTYDSLETNSYVLKFKNALLESWELKSQ